MFGNNIFMFNEVVQKEIFHSFCSKPHKSASPNSP